MKKVRLNALINILTLLFFITSAVSGIILWVFLPSGDSLSQDKLLLSQGLGGELERVFFGLSRSTWSDLHIYSGLIFIILVVTHDMLHWRWYKNLPRILARGERR